LLLLALQSWKGKRISPHVLHHTTAMNLLHAGVDRALIALWLRHESAETTQIYSEYLSGVSVKNSYRDYFRFATKADQ
jgi:site-specific recombinase XerD